MEVISAVSLGLLSLVFSNVYFDPTRLPLLFSSTKILTSSDQPILGDDTIRYTAFAVARTGI
jgi:hypothetical protein